MNKKLLFPLIIVICLATLLFVNAEKLNKAEQRILSENSDVRIIDTDRLITSDEYTAYDFYKDTLPKNELTIMEENKHDPKVDSNLDRQLLEKKEKFSNPKDDFEEEYYSLAIKSTDLAIQMQKLRNKLEFEKNENKIKKYESELSQLLNQYAEVSDQITAVHKKYGVVMD